MKICEDCGHPYQLTPLTTLYLETYATPKCDACIRLYHGDFFVELITEGELEE